MSKQIPKLTDRQLRNFWRKVDKRGPDVCWEWLAHKTQHGYGKVKLHPRGMYAAHRIAHHLATGTDPGELLVCHKCDNPGCCNPGHFFLGTSADNVADRDAKGRRDVRGEKHGSAKLTEAQVLEIRASDATGPALAAKHGVSRSLVSGIRLHQRWKHI